MQKFSQGAQGAIQQVRGKYHKNKWVVEVNCKRNAHSALFSVADAVVAVALATVVASLLTEAP